MFGIGYQEMFIVLVVAMVIFGPSRLPELAGQVGRWVRDFRRMSSDLTGEFEKTFAEVDEVKKSFKREFDSIQNEVEGVGKSTRGDLKKSTSKTSATARKPTAGALKSGTAATARATGLKSGDARNVGAVNGAGSGSMLASKSDPLADVSFFDVEVAPLKSGFVSSLNGKSGHDGDDAISRVRKRRAGASYARRVPA